MANYDNTNRFIFSKNERKRTDRDADWTGSININGVEYWLNGWIQERKDGSGKFISGSARAKEQRDDPPARSNKRNYREELDDEIPF